MAYIRVDKTLMENGVVVDMLSDETLFVQIRSSGAKAVDAERKKQQQPYRNILMAGRELPRDVARKIGLNVYANAVVVAVAGKLPDDREVGRIEGGKPVELVQLPADELIALFEAFPDFQDDISTAANSTATFAAVDSPPTGEQEPTTGEAIEAAAKN